jgi:hypothetical protein
MPKPLADALPKPPSVETTEPRPTGATTPSPERIKEAIREANNPNRVVKVPPQNSLLRRER